MSAHGDDAAMTSPSPRITKYVLIPMPRTDARPRRFLLAPVDQSTLGPWLSTSLKNSSRPQ